MDKSIKIIGIVSFIVGIVLLIVSIAFTIYFSTFRNNSYKLESIILETSNGSDESYTIIEFEINGNKQTTKLNVYSSTFDLGDTLTIYYHKTSHKIIDKVSMIVVPSILGFIGLIFSLVGFFMVRSFICVFLFKKNKSKFDKEIGIVSDVIINNSVSVNSMHPYRIICDVQYNNKALKLKSKNIYREIEFIPNSIVDVYFKNEKKYYIDDQSYRENNSLSDENVK